MAINRSLIQKELYPGLHKVLGQEYDAVEEDYKELFEIAKSDKAQEFEVMKTGFGTAAVKAEGAGIAYDEAKELWTARYVHETIGLAFSITEEAMEDNLYVSEGKKGAAALGRSLANAREIKAAAFFNNGFSTSYPIGDGAAFFSAAHQTYSGTNQSNYTNTDLSETALENALIDISLFKDDRGILINAAAEKLVVPPQLWFTAAKILGSNMSTVTETNSTTGVTNTNKINVINQSSLFPKGYKKIARLTDTNAWFIKTDVKDGTKMFQRAPVKTKMFEDFDTGNLKFKAYERYSFGVSDWRGWYGSAGSS